MFHLAKEVQVVLESFVMVMEATVVMEKTSLVQVASVALGLATVHLVTMEAVFELVEATVIVAVCAVNLHIMDP